jgi:hypothetical protein
MELKYHKTLTVERWAGFGFTKQILMIANELGRAGSWLEKQDYAEGKLCYERAFELLFLTIALVREPSMLRELVRFQEMLASLYNENPPSLQLNTALLNVLIMFDPDSYAALNAA